MKQFVAGFFIFLIIGVIIMIAYPLYLAHQSDVEVEQRSEKPIAR